MLWLYGQFMHIDASEASPAEGYLSALEKHPRGSSEDITIETKDRPIIRTQKEVHGIYYQIVDRLLDVFILSDAYDTRQLRNDTMSALQLFHNSTGWYSDCVWLVTKAFSKLPESSSLCQYLIKSWALLWHGKEVTGEFAHDMTALSTAFLVPVLCLTAKRESDGGECKSQLKQELDEWCTFHEHPDEEEKRVCKEKRETNRPFFRNFILACTEIAIREDTNITQDSLVRAP
ncbi:hypothetical protein P280DRAFT_94151 [Massarina eburnea CBS 473.64]|uniref:BTB domain-containing protein n=1 Tax=Massarina eburnea CBS 473.64 TaxID=1395130 RepID=A0A6A6RQ10_9PLEO|nr:hypothetical protein P280DRAFT_94151 [Massarina eburnea CBS 473.64]